MLVLYLLLAVVLIVYSTSKLQLHPFLALLLAAILYGLASGMELPLLIQSINEGFGGTLGKIGLVIIMGVIIGAFLEESGGAYAIAERILKIIGEKRVPLAMTIIGYIVSIPVFADSGFVILAPLNRALTKRAKQSLAVTAMALSIGLLASHALIPPTPGPIAAAGILNANLGMVIFWGLVTTILALIPTFFIITRLAARYYIDPNPALTEAEIVQKRTQAPSAFKSVLPIVVPILLIVLKSFNDYANWVTKGPVYEGLNFLGTPVIALLIGLAFALLLPKRLEKYMLSTEGWVGKALKEAAIIIMITGAGGIFGKVLQNSGIATVIGDTLGTYNIGLLLPFLIAAAIKTAQGSSTVALITTASIMAPLMGQLGMESETTTALVVLIIGAGSLVVSHANDSFFWVVTQMSDMDVATGYRLQSVGTGMLGCFAAIVIFVIWLFIG